MKIVISVQSELPIYAQIREQIKEQILAGTLAENSYLPSIRKLAKEAGVSVITTTRAYNELEQEGFIASVQGKGSVVLPRDNPLIREQYLKRIEEAFQTAIGYAGNAGIEHRELLQILEQLLEEGE